MSEAEIKEPVEVQQQNVAQQQPMNFDTEINTLLFRTGIYIEELKTLSTEDGFQGDTIFDGDRISETGKGIIMAVDKEDIDTSYKRFLLKLKTCLTKIGKVMNLKENIQANKLGEQLKKMHDLLQGLAIEVGEEGKKAEVKMCDGINKQQCEEDLNKSIEGLEKFRNEVEEALENKNKDIEGFKEKANLLNELKKEIEDQTKILNDTNNEEITDDFIEKIKSVIEEKSKPIEDDIVVQDIAALNEKLEEFKEKIKKMKEQKEVIKIKEEKKADLLAQSSALERQRLDEVTASQVTQEEEGGVDVSKRGEPDIRTVVKGSDERSNEQSDGQDEGSGENVVEEGPKNEENVVEEGPKNEENVVEEGPKNEETVVGKDQKQQTIGNISKIPAGPLVETPPKVPPFPYDDDILANNVLQVTSDDSKMLEDDADKSAKYLLDVVERKKSVPETVDDGKNLGGEGTLGPGKTPQLQTKGEGNPSAPQKEENLKEQEALLKLKEREALLKSEENLKEQEALLKSEENLESTQQKIDGSKVTEMGGGRKRKQSKKKKRRGKRKSKKKRN